MPRRKVVARRGLSVACLAKIEATMRDVDEGRKLLNEADEWMGHPAACEVEQEDSSWKVADEEEHEKKESMMGEGEYQQLNGEKAMGRRLRLAQGRVEHKEGGTIWMQQRRGQALRGLLRVLVPPARVCRPRWVREKYQSRATGEWGDPIRGGLSSSAPGGGGTRA